MATDGYQAANGVDELAELFGGDDLFGNDIPDESGEMPFPNGFDAPAAEDDEEEMAALKTAIGEGFITDTTGDDLAGAEKYLREREGQELEEEEKAADAVDFEDISDDDLPEEEYTESGHVQQPPILAEIEDVAMGDGDFDNDDDLFGPSSPMQEAPDGQEQFLHQHDRNDGQDAQDDGQDAADSDLASEHEEEATSPNQLPEADEVEDPSWLLQRQLFALSGTGVAPETEKENIEEWLKLEFPSFSRDDVPFFSQLFPPKTARWVGKAPLKPPKPIRPNKVSLEIEPDQKATFNSSIQPLKRSWEEDSNVVVIEDPEQAEEEEDSAEESGPDETLPGGLTMQDLDAICADFDTLSAIADSDFEAEEMAVELENDDASMFGYDDFNDFEHPVKKRKTGMSAKDIVSVYNLPMPSFDDPEELTKKIGRKVILDLNDPQLLVEEVDPEALRARTRPGDNTKRAGSLKERLTNRFNFSNDADYDMLKQNHSNKIRAQLSTITVEHSVPALRLQFPYYKVKMPVNEMRNFHRKKLEFRYLAFGFEKPDKAKRKHQKGKTVKELYDNTKKLSLADNSHSLLLEYSEEHPMMLSQTGMGNKVVNYYKRKTTEDSSRPKGDIGDTNVLLLEDRSPFSMFGKIEPGETITAIHNSMYRAPIFKQNPSHEDFLVVREHTGMGGWQYYIRNVDHIYTVGQELPFVTVPGPHSRAVTTAAKNRLKAISFRIARRKKYHRIRVEDVTRHFPDTTDMQNRQKMKEFMTFSKEHKEWEMKPGEVLPDEAHIQTLLTPEYISLLESMQVGQQYLADAGFGGDDDDEDDEKEGENQTIEQELAPWKTTKNFLNATQGKAMLTLYGDGDPSGRGEALSFIKTSMKGGFKAKGAPINDMLTEADKKKLGGHSYNVAAQQREYDNSIKAIWDKQKRVLSSDAQASEDEDGVDGQDDSVIYNGGRGRSVTSTPAPARRRDDETATSFSKRSITSQTQKFLKIVRKYTNRNGEEQTEEHIETNPTVIKNYLKARIAKEEDNMEYVYIGCRILIHHVLIKQPHRLSKINLNTGDAELDARGRKKYIPPPFSPFLPSF